MEITLVCEDSFEGIMTAIYDAWILMNQGNQVTIFPGEYYTKTFFCEYRKVTTDFNKSNKVATSIRYKISLNAYVMVYRVCMHYSTKKADIILDFLKIGYVKGAGVIKMLSHPAVISLMKLNRKVANEVHNLKGFLRFRELPSGVLFGNISPKCDIVPLLERHFTERFPNENWVIYDDKRKKALLHSIGKECIMVMGDVWKGHLDKLRQADQYEALWEVFFEAISIETRKNSKYQQTSLPKWYRKNMLEFLR